MQLVVGILIGLAVGAVAAYVVARFLLTGRVRAAAEERERLLADAERDGEAIRREAQVAAREQAVKLRADVDQEVKDRQAEIIRIETRVAEKEEEIDRKLGELDRGSSRSRIAKARWPVFRSIWSRQGTFRCGSSSASPA